MKSIPLTKGYKVLVDDSDYEYLMTFKWSASESNGGGHVCAKTGGGKHRQVMHRLLMEAGPGQVVDHINGNPLDNRRGNLRLVTKRWMNNANTGKVREGSSIYKGVTYHKASERWSAHIARENTSYHLGLFDTERDAAIAYNVASRFLHGEWGRLNDVE